MLAYVETEDTVAKRGVVKYLWNMDYVMNDMMTMRFEMISGEITPKELSLSTCLNGNVDH